MRDPAARRAAILALIEGATTGERAAARAALERHDARHGDPDPVVDLTDTVRQVQERPPDIVWGFPGKQISSRSGGDWGLHKRIGRLYLAWPPWAHRCGCPDSLMALSWIVDPEMHRLPVDAVARLRVLEAARLQRGAPGLPDRPPAGALVRPVPAPARLGVRDRGQGGCPVAVTPPAPGRYNRAGGADGTRGL